jgi:hypothetical protein
VTENNGRIRQLGQEAEFRIREFMEETDRLAMSSTGRTVGELRHLNILHGRMIQAIQQYEEAVAAQ